jgi:hypothetical protein
MKAKVAMMAMRRSKSRLDPASRSRSDLSLSSSAPTAHAHFPGMEGSFVILSFASQIALNVVYIKNVAGGI